jgi:hypothetical protein
VLQQAERPGEPVPKQTRPETKPQTPPPRPQVTASCDACRRAGACAGTGAHHQAFGQSPTGEAQAGALVLN